MNPDNQDKCGVQDNDVRPLTILLVEDNEADVKITLRAFEHARIKNRVRVVRNGQECLDYCLRNEPFCDAREFPRPQLILLDINMPKMDGFDVLKSMKGRESISSIPVIVLSGSKNDEDVCRCFALGANSFIQKPVVYEEFVKVIDGINHYWNVLNRLPETKE